MPAPAAPEDLLSYSPKRDKVVEGVLFLLEQVPQRGVAMTVDNLITVMFLTDKGHLDAYGRPVFFDNYIATAEGPAGVAVGEMLEPTFDWASIGMETAPWTLDPDNGDRLVRMRGPNLRRLSETDVEALSSALATVASLDAEQLRVFTHRNGAYASAWRNGAGAGSRLDPRLVPERRDDGMIDDLIYASRHAFVAPRRP